MPVVFYVRLGYGRLSIGTFASSPRCVWVRHFTGCVHDYLTVAELCVDDSHVFVSWMAVSRTLVGFPSWTPPFMEITYLVLALLLAATLTLGLVMTA